MEFCVMCGRILPTECGSQVCQTCELTSGIKFMQLLCPECGKPMEVKFKDVTDYRPENAEAGWAFSYMAVDLIYHCDCGCDWDSKYVKAWGDEMQALPKRHFWG